jgi:cell division septum initiation protein DivIVA
LFIFAQNKNINNMGFFKKLFIVEEEDEKKTQPAQTQQPQQQPQQPQYQQPYQQQYQQPQYQQYQPQYQAYQPSAGQVDQDILKMISDVIEQNNIEGNDYFELNKIVDSQDFIVAIPDKRARTVAAFHSLKAQDPDFNKQKVIESIDFYKNAVNQEFQNVLQAYENMVEEKINAPKQKIEDMQNQKNELLQKIAELDNSILQVQGEIEQSTRELTAKRADYEATFNVVQQKLDAEKNELNTILP